MTETEKIVKYICFTVAIICALICACYIQIARQEQETAQEAVKSGMEQVVENQGALRNPIVVWRKKK